MPPAVSDRQALTLLRATFGNVVVRSEPRIPKRPVVVKDRALARKHAASVGVCGNPERCERQEPVYPRRPRFVAVVGKREPLHRAVLGKLGFDPHEDVAWLRACPRTSCGVDVIEQIEAAHVNHVLLVGSVAKSLWRPDLEMEWVVGGLFVWRERWAVMPVNDGITTKRLQTKGQLRDSLGVWAEVVNGQIEPLTALGRRCIRCGAFAEAHDRDGVPWCKSHFRKGSEGALQRVVR